MKTFYFELIGLIGFFISGLIFIVAGLRSGDYLAVSGSIIWTVACLLWLIPVISRRNSQGWTVSRSFLKIFLFKFSSQGIYLYRQIKHWFLLYTVKRGQKVCGLNRKGNNFLLITVSYEFYGWFYKEEKGGD